MSQGWVLHSDPPFPCAQNSCPLHLSGGQREVPGPRETSLLSSQTGESPVPYIPLNVILSGNQMKSKCSCRTVCADPAAPPLRINPAAESWLTDCIPCPTSAPVYSLLGGGTGLVMSRYVPSPVRLLRPRARSFLDWGDRG